MRRDGEGEASIGQSEVVSAMWCVVDFMLHATMTKIFFVSDKEEWRFTKKPQIDI
jgi:hypothetical protein